MANHAQTVGSRVRKQAGAEYFRLALVDDEQSVRASVRQIIETGTNGWTLHTYASGGHALREIPSARPDVVLMDIRMPDFDGVECTRRLKAVLPELRVLMFTGCSEKATILHSIAAGACGYLLKPVGPDALVRAVRSASEGRVVLCPEAQNALVAELQAAGTHGPVAGLTSRENEVLSLLARRLTYGEIAMSLGVETSTVNEHVKRIYRKLGVRTRAAAVREMLGGAGSGASVGP